MALRIDDTAPEFASDTTEGPIPKSPGSVTNDGP
jgi:hypothetical protein